MKRTFFLFLLLVISTVSIAQLLTKSNTAFTLADSLRGTLFPERSCYDVSYYHLDVDIDIEKKFIVGKNTITFKVVNDFDNMQVDLFSNMNVDKITWKGKELKYKRKFNAVFVKFPQKLTKNTLEEIVFYYSGNPQIAKNAPWDGGFVFGKDEFKKDWIAVACQGAGASLWWPNKDHQSDEPDSMLISITIPSSLTEISNGKLRSKINLKNNKTQHNWFVKNPINNYNVTVNIGNYAHFGDTYVSKVDGQKLSLDYYVMPYNLEKAKKQFEQVKGMMDAFENRFGKYPFYEDGYKLVETPYLGMEHQSCIAYGNKYLQGYLGTDLSGTGGGLLFDYIIIHETAHEWWGNSITSFDIADMWIHEGFGQYAEAVYIEELFGKDRALKYINGLKRGVGNKEPIIGMYGVNKEGSGDMYPKGALMLNTLRSIINNDSIWWDIVKSICSNFRHKTVTNEEIIELINKKSGMVLTPIFNQYLKYPSLPKLQLRCNFDKNDLYLEYNWLTDVSDFNMPVDLKISKENIVRIYPKISPQKIKIPNVTENEFGPDTGRFYINVEELMHTKQ